MQQGTSQQFGGKVLPPSMVTLGSELGILYQVTSIKVNFLWFFATLTLSPLSGEDFAKTCMNSGRLQIP